MRGTLRCASPKDNQSTTMTNKMLTETSSPLGLQSGDEHRVVQVTMCQAKALHDYTAAAQDELSFGAGDVIDVEAKDEVSGWWQGKLKNGSRGIFPGNYVEEVHLSRI